MNSWKRDLRRLMNGAAQFDAQLAPRVTTRTGGQADAFVRVHCVEQLHELDRFARWHEVPLTVLGGGSNVLVSDRGIRGITVHMADDGSWLKHSDKQTSQQPGKLTVWAGVRNAELVKHLLRQGRTGLEFLCGIPGTIGGAAATNAGAHGFCIAQFVEAVTVLDSCGALEQRNKQNCNFGYRTGAARAGEIIVSITLRLAQGSQEESEKLICAQHARRMATQPMRLPSAGCTFLNPADDFAARLIEQCGLKGNRVGGAMISKQHANFIVNRGGTTSSEIHQLGESARSCVRAERDVNLEWEIKLLGDWRLTANV